MSSGTVDLYKDPEGFGGWEVGVGSGGSVDLYEDKKDGSALMPLLQPWPLLRDRFITN